MKIKNIIFSLILFFASSSNSEENTISINKPFSFADIVEPLIPAVVNINTVKYPQKNNNTGANRFDPFGENHPFRKFNDLFEKFGDPFLFEDFKERKTMSLGSGFIIDKDGYIVTNHHVVKDADEISVKLNDNTEIKAKLVGSDSRTDIALLKVDYKKSLPFVRFGNSSKSRVGDWVVAIGNPFGLGGTVTTGIISSKSRDIDYQQNGIIDDFIQTDAAINTGNSGGPMFNMEGEVIGVNTAIISPSGTNIGIGFSIPSDTAKDIVEQLKKNGKINRGKLGIRIQELTPEIAEGLGIDRKSGSLVVTIEPGSDADKAGLKEGDIIIEYNGQKVQDTRRLQIMVAETPVKSKVTLKIIRDSKEVTINAFISEQNDSENVKISSSTSTKLEIEGIEFENLAKSQLSSYGLDNGVRVSSKKRNSKWISFVEGDVVIAINQKYVNDVNDIKTIYQEAKSLGRKNLVFLVKRSSYSVFLALPIN